MLSRSLIVAAVLSVTLTSVGAVNDWSKPCFDGECAYDIPASTEVSGAIKLYGSPKSISDITPAAGWVILDCDAHSLDQDIRLVCETEHEGSGCQHVFDHHGPMDKIVRLPESCGGGPFARIANMKVAADQTLPQHAEQKVRRRDGVAPTVHVMSIDSNWAAIDHTKAGEVNFAFVGATVPGLDLNAAFADWFWDDIGKWVSNAANSVAKAVTDAAHWVGDRFQDLGNLIADKTKFDIQPKIESQDISLNANVNIPEFSFPPAQCSGSEHSRLNINIDSKGSIRVKAGIVIAGSILPLPKITKFAAFGGVNGSVDAKVHVDVALKGGFTYERKLLNDLGLPGLSIPALITIGPYLSVAAKAQGYIELDLTTDVHLAYQFDDLQMWYPASEAPKARDQRLKSKDSDFNLKASAKLNAQGFAQGTLSPQVHFGVTAIGGSVSASFYVAADAWVRATVVAQADASVNAGKSAAPAAPAGKGKKHRRESNELAYSPPYGSLRRDVLSPRDSIGFSGCAWIDVGLHLRGGAEGHIFSWSAEASVSIWESPAWEVFSKCWAVGAAKAPTGVSKPKFSIAEVESQSKKPAGCSAAPELSNAVSDKVAGKALKAK